MSKVEERLALLLSGKGINDIIAMLCRERLGSGVYRDVYVLKDDPDYVVKIERDMSTGQFCNVMEWRYWIENKMYKKLSVWLAPCVLINETGQVMIQRRVEFRDKREYPRRIPAVFTDLKTSNFGWIGDRFVCCDYGSVLDFYAGEMKSVRWAGKRQP